MYICILQDAVESDSVSDDNNHGVQTVNTGLSVGEYFAQKMASIKAKLTVNGASHRTVSANDDETKQVALDVNSGCSNVDVASSAYSLTSERENVDEASDAMSQCDGANDTNHKAVKSSEIEKTLKKKAKKAKKSKSKDATIDKKESLILTDVNASENEGTCSKKDKKKKTKVKKETPDTSQVNADAKKKKSKRLKKEVESDEVGNSIPMANLKLKKMEKSKKRDATSTQTGQPESTTAVASSSNDETEAPGASNRDIKASREDNSKKAKGKKRKALQAIEENQDVPIENDVKQKPAKVKKTKKSSKTCVSPAKSPDECDLNLQTDAQKVKTKKRKAANSLEDNSLASPKTKKTKLQPVPSETNSKGKKSKSNRLKDIKPENAVETGTDQPKSVKIDKASRKTSEAKDAEAEEVVSVPPPAVSSSKTAKKNKKGRLHCIFLTSYYMYAHKFVFLFCHHCSNLFCT